MQRQKLTTEQIDEELKNLSKGWTFRENRLYKRFEFRDFREAFSFMTYVALSCESLNHHPNWSNVYRTVEIEIFTHDVGGITELDFALAKICEEF